jgi:hypothetical protein
MCHQDVDIVLIPDSCILDHCGHNALKANHKKISGFLLMLVKSASFSDSSSDDTDCSDDALDADDLMMLMMMMNLNWYYFQHRWSEILFC